jgi:putative peptidoglycan lipid II flippase
MIYAVAAVIFTIVVGTALFFGLSRIGVDGVLGLAVATSLSAWINVALLGGTLVRENVWRPSPAFLSRLFRVLAASGVMAGLLVFAGIGYEALSRALLAKEIAVLVVCGAGALVYGACIVLFRAVSLAELKATLKREPGAVAPTGLD